MSTSTHCLLRWPSRQKWERISSNIWSSIPLCSDSSFKTCNLFPLIVLDIITSTSTSFWSQSIHSDLILEGSMPSPSLAHTLFKIYKSSPSFTASAFFKIKPVWLSDVCFVPYDKSSLVPVVISTSAPLYLLDVQSLPSLPSGIPISSDMQLRYQWQKVTWFNSSHHTPFFSFENNTH